MQKSRELRRDDGRIIIHFDYDCFYASVVENENPALKSVPLGIQQKQIIVTANYVGRSRGLHKLQLITEAKQVCPEAVIILGEDLTRFRNASKALYNFLRERTWSDRAERLGFDEVWLDCTDMVDYNANLLNHNDLSNSFFCMDRADPTAGFSFDASSIFGPTYPPKDNALGTNKPSDGLSDAHLRLRLVLGSHLARHLRHELESQRGYSATVGVGTNKIVSKLVGNLQKPGNQTTITPPYEPVGSATATVTAFMDTHDIGKVPGVGFKLAQKIRQKILGRTPTFQAGLVYGGTKESISVQNVRLHPGMGPEMLEEVLSGPGSQKGIGGKVWELLHGIDDSEVAKAKRVPSQVSQEDSYMKYLYSFDQVRKQLHLLSERLIIRMHIDLMEDDDELEGDMQQQRRWLAHPRTLRLTTRPRPAPGPDGVRPRTFQRISRSAPMPNFVFSLQDTPSALAERLVDDSLVPMFRKLHPETSGWNLSLINVACTNMAETAADSKDSSGRDIGRMFRRQEDFLKDFRLVDEAPDDDKQLSLATSNGAACSPASSHGELASDQEWDAEPPEDVDDVHECTICDARIPVFAAAAHSQYHESTEQSQ